MGLLPGPMTGGGAMTDPRVLVVGAGLAGLGAAVALARAGVAVLVVDQAQAAGGAIHRQPFPGAQSIASAAQRRRWATLMAAVAAQADRITLRCDTRFGGMDHTGMALLTGAGAALMRPRGLIVATGARERVQPRPGWTLPGVTTAGAIQSALKTLGQPPEGRVLLAGSGPLLLAVGAELSRLGRPPLAIVEAARPFAHPFAALALPLPYLAEAGACMARLKVARVPILTGAHLAAINRTDGALVATIDTRNGRRTLTADQIGLHDGIAPNDGGLAETGVVPMLRLGDCREALGARAALADGLAGGARLAAMLAGGSPPAASAGVARERQAQARLARIYRHDGLARLPHLPPETVLCRCENRTLGDLRSLGPSPTTRQLRLDGRFAMGACQGRFCAEWVSRLAAADAPAMPRLGANRWPARPILISDFVDVAPEGTTR